jgi:hypothetical protein
MLFSLAPLNTTASQKMANIANILPILVILCIKREKKNILDVIFLGLLHSKDILLCYSIPQMSINTTIFLYKAGISVPNEKTYN